MQDNLLIETQSSDSGSLSDLEMSDLLGEQNRQAAPADFYFPSPVRVQQVIGELLQKPLSPEFSSWVDRYGEVGHRNPYLWTWCRQAVEVTTLPCVERNLKDELCDTKTLGVMLDVLLDDIADRGGNFDLLEELMILPVGRTSPDLSRFTSAEQNYAQFAVEVWREIMRRAETFPCFEEYRELLRFDYLQLCNVMRYSFLVNSKPELLNLTEHDVYTPPNMHIMICSTFDLMCSPRFDRSELGKFREFIWQAQQMGRIGNLITTWERELGEEDFVSGVYARALKQGDLTVEQLKSGNPGEIKSAIDAGGHELYFKQRWLKHRRFLLSERMKLRSFDVRQLVAGLEKLICLHLGSRGYK